MQKKQLSQQIIHKELIRIQAKHGAITPPLVVAEARPDTAVLHKHFQWDNTKAAQAYREWQARQVIATVTFQHPQMDTPVRTFHSVVLEAASDDGEVLAQHVYMSTAEILKNPFTRHQLIERAHREASEFALRYKALVELAEIISVIKRVVPGLKKKLSK
jgi:hypothetical protein